MCLARSDSCGACSSTVPVNRTRSLAISLLVDREAVSIYCLCRNCFSHATFAVSSVLVLESILDTIKHRLNCNADRGRREADKGSVHCLDYIRDNLD
jgi:hypothetical protein